jgi:large subunit ribosomal protein L30
VSAAKAAGTPAEPRGAKKSAGGDRITITLVKSGICTPKDQKATLKGLGFRRLGQQVVRQDTPAIRGMIRKVRHLLEVTAG